MSNDDDRRALAEQQGALVAALAAGNGAPQGMDPGRVKLAARSLHVKRALAVSKTWPVLKQGLGEQFNVIFARYATTNPLPPAGPVDDGRAFSEWLKQAGLLDDPGRLHLTLYRARRGWPVRLGWMPSAGRVVVAVRVGRVRWLEIPVLTQIFKARRVRASSASDPSG